MILGGFPAKYFWEMIMPNVRGGSRPFIISKMMGCSLKNLQNHIVLGTQVGQKKIGDWLFPM